MVVSPKATAPTFSEGGVKNQEVEIARGKSKKSGKPLEAVSRSGEREGGELPQRAIVVAAGLLQCGAERVAFVFGM